MEDSDDELRRVLFTGFALTKLLRAFQGNAWITLSKITERAKLQEVVRSENINLRLITSN